MVVEKLKKLVRPYRINYFRKKNRLRFERGLKRRGGGELKIVVGSSGKFEAGWLATERYFLNLLDEKDWFGYFKESSINNILAEHVWEHLTLEEGTKAISVCYKFLAKNGRLRIAVPDGFHPNEQYIEYVKVNGLGRGADDHKVLYNYELLCRILEEAGFTVEPLEYYDENGVFRSKKWDLKDGYVFRRYGNGEMNPDNIPEYSSLIVDGIKN